MDETARHLLTMKFALPDIYLLFRYYICYLSGKPGQTTADQIKQGKQLKFPALDGIRIDSKTKYLDSKKSKWQILDSKCLAALCVCIT